MCIRDRRAREASVFGQEELRAANRFGQHGQRCAAADFPRDRCRGAQDRSKQARQEHHRKGAVLDQFRFVAKPEIIDAGQKHLEQRGYRHEQQENRLPNQLHKGIAGNCNKLSHVSGRASRRNWPTAYDDFAHLQWLNAKIHG